MCTKATENTHFITEINRYRAQSSCQIRQNSVDHFRAQTHLFTSIVHIVLSHALPKIMISYDNYKTQLDASFSQ